MYLPLAVHCLAYDAYRIVSGSADSTICVWKVASNAPWLAQTLRGHSHAVRCLALIPLPSHLRLRFEDTPSSPPDSPQSSSSSSADPVSPSNHQQANSPRTPPSVWEPPEALLVSGSADTTLKLWRLSSTYSWSRITCISTLQGHFDTVRCVQVSRPGLLKALLICFSICLAQLVYCYKPSVLHVNVSMLTVLFPVTRGKVLKLVPCNNF